MGLGSGPQGRDPVPLNHPSSSCSQHRGVRVHGLCWLRTEGMREGPPRGAEAWLMGSRSFSQPLQSDNQKKQQADVNGRLSEKNAGLLEAEALPLL